MIVDVSLDQSVMHHSRHMGRLTQGALLWTVTCFRVSMQYDQYVTTFSGPILVDAMNEWLSWENATK